MTVKVFLELVEIKAKTASVFPFILGMMYAWYHYHQVYLGHMLFFFVAMFIFNMAVDMLDNYMDYHHATEVHDYREETNIIGRENLSLPLIRNLIIAMISLSALMGIYLASQTSWVILFLGVISYSVGIFYSAGPKPLSSLPVGEIASGLTMGFVIPLICVYLNVYDRVAFDWHFVGEVLLMSLPAVFGIANLMLANNTCDLEEDILNNRFTLAYYLGRERSVGLFRWLVCGSFVVVIISVLLKIVPWTLLLLWLIFPKIWKNTKKYAEKQVKKETFPLAIQNLALIVSVEVLLFGLGLLLN